MKIYQKKSFVSRSILFLVSALMAVSAQGADHVRLEQRFAAVNAEEWRLAADTSIGTTNNYLRLGVHSQIDDNKAGAHIFYSREF